MNNWKEQSELFIIWLTVLIDSVVCMNTLNLFAKVQHLRASNAKIVFDTHINGLIYTIDSIPVLVEIKITEQTDEY